MFYEKGVGDLRKKVPEPNGITHFPNLISLSFYGNALCYISVPKYFNLVVFFKDLLATSALWGRDMKLLAHTPVIDIGYCTIKPYLLRQHVTFPVRTLYTATQACHNLHRSGVPGRYPLNRKRAFGGLKVNKKIWKELIRLLSLHYLIKMYQLHCLPTVNYVPSLASLQYLPWLLWLENGSNNGTNCCTSMGSTATREWGGYHG
jgi:hypothetical protein